MSETAIHTASLTASAQRRGLSETTIATTLIALLVVILFVIIALPLWALLSKSFQDLNGSFVGFRNFSAYFSTPTLVGSLINSVWVAALSTLIVVPLAFVYAYGLTRSCMPAKGLFYAAALVPVFAPSLLSAISLIYIFGNQGFLKALLFGGSIYGPRRHSAGGSALLFPARFARHGHGTRAFGRPALRGRCGAGHVADPRVSYGHAAGARATA